MLGENCQFELWSLHISSQSSIQCDQVPRCQAPDAEDKKQQQPQITGTHSIFWSHVLDVFFWRGTGAALIYLYNISSNVVTGSAH